MDRHHAPLACASWGIVATLLLAVGQVAAATDPLNFDGGVGAHVVDAYTGMPGAGWTTPWSISSQAVGTPTVTNANPLTPEGGNYLSVDVTGSDRNVIRQYGNTAEFNVASAHTISWQWRLDSEFEVNSQFDRINFFANSVPASSSTTASNSWTIGVAPTLMGFDNWYFYDRQIDSSFGPQNAVNTGISLRQGVTYFFSVDVNPGMGTYKATISDGSLSFTSGDLNFRSPSINSTYLHFGGKVDGANDPLSFSLDAVTISGGSAEAGPVYFPGFRGIWYANQSLAGTEWAEYGYKYSGGFGTYPQQMRPQAYYAEEVNKTFFTFGATNENNSDLYHVVSYYDHTTGQVARPRLLLSKGTTDAHDNPTMMMDAEGYIYIFSASHGTGRPSYINRSTTPYSIDSFEQVLALPGNNNFSYTQPLYVEGNGFMFLHTLYTSSGRTLKFNTSSDGINWDHPWNDRPTIVQISGGQYQISEVNGQRVGTAFNWHPGGVVNARTNLYYMETTDFGDTWQTVDGTPLTTPVTTVTNAALVRDYQAEGKLVFLKDIQYDQQGNPILLYLTSNDWHPGPSGDPRTWTIAHHRDGQWQFKEIFTSDHNYDHGSLYIEPDGTWRIIAPTADGPIPWTTGGDMVMWTSHDEGQTWEANWQLTSDSQFNHSYARRPVNAHDDFYALWADGNTLARSASRLYFTDRNGTAVWQLPWTMEGEFATPEIVHEPVLLSPPRTVGDFNGDGVVDAADYTVWRNSVGGTDLAADANGDQLVDARDYHIWKAHFGRVLQTAQTPELSHVPEPTALRLVASVVVLMAWPHFRRSRVGATTSFSVLRSVDSP